MHPGSLAVACRLYLANSNSPLQRKSFTHSAKTIYPAVCRDLRICRALKCGEHSGCQQRSCVLGCVFHGNFARFSVRRITATAKRQVWSRNCIRGRVLPSAKPPSGATARCVVSKLEIFDDGTTSWCDFA